MGSNRLFNYTNLIRFEEEMNKDVLQRVIQKAENLVISSKMFDLKTVNSLIFLINNEIRDDMKPEFVFSLINVLYKSTTVAQKLTKFSEYDRINFHLFMENGLQYYIKVVKTKRKSYAQILKLWSDFRDRLSIYFRSRVGKFVSPLANFRDLVKKLQEERTDAKSTDTKGTDTKGTDTKGTDTKGTDTKGTDTKGTDTKGTDTKGNDAEESDISLVLPSPMEEAEEKAFQDILERPISPSLPEDSDAADSSSVESFFDKDAIPEKL